MASSRIAALMGQEASLRASAASADELRALAKEAPRELAEALVALKTSPWEPGVGAFFTLFFLQNAEHALVSAEGFESARAAILVDAAVIQHMPPLPQPLNRRGISLEEGTRRLAALLAAGRRPEACLELIDRLEENSGTFEIRCSLLQELVLRGVDVTASEAAMRLRQEMRGKNHPLAQLPMTREPWEERLPTAWDFEKSSWITHPAPDIETFETIPRDEPHLEGILELASPLGLPDLLALQHAEFSEAGFFSVPRRDAADVALLRGLPLQLPRYALAIAGATIDGESAFRELFFAAGTPGTRTFGKFGAHGRLAAWRALAAFTGRDRGAELSSIAEAANRCSWLLVEDTAVRARGLGLIALREDRRSVVARFHSEPDDLT